MGYNACHKVAKSQIWLSDGACTRACAHTHTRTHILLGLRQTQFYAYYLGVNITRASFHVQIILTWTMKCMITPEMMSLSTGCNQMLTEGRAPYHVIFSQVSYTHLMLFPSTLMLLHSGRT